MSSELDQMNALIAKDKEIYKEKQDLAEKEFIIRKMKANNAMEQIEQANREMQETKELSFASLTDSQIDAIRLDNLEYLKNAKNNSMFICKTFGDSIPLFARNLIVISGESGNGKSTTVANMTSTMIGEISKVTGKRKRVLVISNEESASDVYNRITCLAKGWEYSDHGNFSAEQIDTFDKMIKALAKYVTVVDKNHGVIYGKGIGLTSSLEGIQSIFEDLVSNKIHYDCIIIDYYQNVKTSKKKPWMDQYSVQADLAAMLDMYKNICSAPIVIFSQMKPQDKEESKQFEDRMKGSKQIFVASTVSIEMKPYPEDLKTKWIIHKNRFTKATNNKHFWTGFDHGRFVDIDNEFQAKINTRNEQKMLNAALHRPDDITIDKKRDIE